MNGAISAVGIVTIVFAILDHEKLRITVLDSWNPASLPEPQAGRPIPRSESVFGLIFSLTFLVWWVDLVRVPAIPLVSGDPVHFVPGPIWAQLYYPILASLVASVVIYLIDLVRPWRTRAVSAADIILGLANVAIVVVVLRSGPDVDVTADPQFVERAATLAKYINVSIAWTFAVIGAITIWDVLNELWKLTRSRSNAALSLLGA